MAMNQTRDAFDPFAADDDESTANFGSKSFSTKQSDPWSSTTWPNSAEFLSNTLDPSFDSGALFQFTAASSSDLVGDSFQATLPLRDLFSFDGQQTSLNTAVAEEGPAVQVTIHEQLSCVYDDVSQSPICQVEGSIHAQSAALEEGKKFCLVLHDKKGYLEHLETDEAFCTDITKTLAGAQHPCIQQNSDKVVRVMLPSASESNTAIATYICGPRLRPIPLLVKSRVLAAENYCRVGVKVRSNPSNDSPLRDLAILLAVPPGIQGETVRMSRQGGIWDGMKRTVTWTMEKLHPGEVLEVQAQFETIAASKDGKEIDGQQALLRTPKFPVLVRCYTDDLFSEIEIAADYTDDTSIRVNLDLNKSVRILHRKV